MAFKIRGEFKGGHHGGGNGVPPKRPTSAGASTNSPAPRPSKSARMNKISASRKTA